MDQKDLTLILINISSIIEHASWTDMYQRDEYEHNDIDHFDNPMEKFPARFSTPKLIIAGAGWSKTSVMIIVYLFNLPEFRLRKPILFASD